MTSAAKASSSYGFIAENDAGSARKYLVYLAIAINDLASSPLAVSLRGTWEAGDAMPYIKCTKKLQLAVTLSSSFLQLVGTPWLSRYSLSGDVIFLRRSDAYIYDNVFIRKRTHDDPISVSAPTSFLEDKRNPALLSLAFSLVELFFGRPLGQNASVAGQRLESKVNGARDLLPRIRLESNNYFSVVSRCLDGELHTRQYDELYLTEYSYAGVVALLC